MNFSKRLVLLSVVPALVLAGAALVGVAALWRAESRFADIFEKDQPLAQAVTEMYGHGLQMGQALRNIILDPANPTAYKNLEAAQKSYDEAAAVATPLAAGTPAQALLTKVAAARERQRVARDQVLALVKTDTAGAVALLNKAETPAWREMRGGLIEAGKLARAGLQATRDGALADTHKSVLLALGATAFGLVLGAVFTLLIGRALRSTLGGEPELVHEHMRAVASGDLTRNVPLAPGDRGSLMAHLAEMQVTLAGTVRELGVAVTQVSNASREIANGNADLSSRTEQQAASLEQTSASMQQMSDQLRQSAASAQQASRLAEGAEAVASKGGQVVGEVVSTMDAISASSRKIAEIIGVIDGIAFQTNILALNAAVEEARAGEQGRGFAVVAAEVRSLAQRSAGAAREIKQLIGSSVQRVDAGSRLVGDAGSTMRDIVASVARVTQIIGEISDASGHQRTGIGEINQAVTQLDEMTQRNAALVEQSAAAADSLKDQAMRLGEVVAVFRLQQPA